MEKLLIPQKLVELRDVSSAAVPEEASRKGLRERRRVSQQEEKLKDRKQTLPTMLKERKLKRNHREKFIKSNVVNAKLKEQLVEPRSHRSPSREAEVALSPFQDNLILPNWPPDRFVEPLVAALDIFQLEPLLLSSTIVLVS